MNAYSPNKAITSSRRPLSRLEFIVSGVQFETNEISRGLRSAREVSENVWNWSISAKQQFAGYVCCLWSSMYSSQSS